MQYAEAVAYLDGFVNYERALPDAGQRGAFDLTRIRELAARLGDPQRRFPALHVAGTKGKGSACAFADAILRAAGFRTGLYTSPHLTNLRERIRIDGGMISEPDFARHLSACRPHLEEMRARPEGTRRPTYFEVLTHLAFLHFAERKVEVAVVEVGLGGRLDATNLVEPAACGITHISRDHTAILGETLDRIAREKAGILKPGVPAVSSSQTQEAAVAIAEAAEAAGAPLEVIGRDFQVDVSPASAASADAPLPFPQASLRPARRGPALHASLGLRGSFQADNWAVAVRLAQHFHEKVRETPLPADAIQKGSREVAWPGRLDEFPRSAGRPRLFLDGAHNDHSVKTVLSELRAGLPARRPLVVLFGCAKDKDAPAMLAHVQALSEHVVFTTSGNPRGRTPAELAEMWKRLTGRAAPEFPGLAPGLAEAERLAGANGVVLATGSLYLVGALMTARAGEKGSGASNPR